ncbi:MAG: glycosyltransferase family 39 protein [Anaerolineales bacterium]|nr:glycosyltransferase family 39 protein [Anaerolineales bacterium]
MKIFTRRYYENAWYILFGIWLLHGVVAIWQFDNVAQVGGDFLFVGISSKYILIYLLLFLWIFLNIYLLYISIRGVPLWLSWLSVFEKAGTKDLLLVAAFFLLCARCLIWYLSNLLSPIYFPRFLGYATVLMPALNLVSSVGLEVIVFIGFAKVDLWGKEKKALNPLFTKIALICFSLFFLSLVVRFSGLGILPNYKGDWSRGLPAVPLLEWQIVFTCLIGFGVIYFESKSPKFNGPLVNIFIFLFIWLGAWTLWISQPIIPNASALKPQEPNFEIYPFIDAQTYDKEAESILVGTGFSASNVPQRPLYIVFLTTLHLVAGQDYDQMIVIQTLVFSLFPAFLFLLGNELFGRGIGVSLAMLAALRDYTSNLVSPFTGNLSYSKVFLSEIPTALLLVCFLFVGIRWIKSNYFEYLGFLLGGIIGVSMLIRTQAVVVLPVLILFAVLIKPATINTLIKKIPFVIIAVVLVVSPWLWRNWRITGDLIFDNPESQTGNLALRYSRLNGVELDAPRLPNETSSEFAKRLLVIAKNAITLNPMGAIWAVLNSFMNHGVNNILMFPLRDQVETLNEFWIPSSAFWESWEGSPSRFQSILLSFYIFLFGLGLGFAWYKIGWAGLLPLGFNLAYNFWTSLALLSGQRFMLAMDWSVYLYYMLGLFTLLNANLLLIGKTRRFGGDWMREASSVETTPIPNVKWQKYLLLSVLFLGIGLSVALVEQSFPNRYPFVSYEELTSSLLESHGKLHFQGINSVCLNRIFNDFEINIFQGRALYPRYYQAGDGEATDAFGYKSVDYGRLVFEVVGQASFRVVFPMQQSPVFFPHASDVTLISSQSGEPWFVLVSQEGHQEFYASDNFDEALCD